MAYVFLVAVGALFGALVLGAVFAFRKRPLPGAVRIVFVLLLLAPIPFSLFGFAASFEPGPNHWVWRIAYATIIVGCLGTILRLCWPRR